MGRRFGTARSIALDISPLTQSPAYRALWLGQIVSLMGTQMRYVAVAYQVFIITDSTVAVGLIGLVEVIPLIVFSIIGGAVADRVERKGLVAKAQIGSILAAAGLALVSFLGRPSLWWIYGFTAIASAVNGFDRPARTAMIPRLVPKGKLPAAMALRQVVFQVTQIVGPAVGGFMLASFDFGWVYVIDAVTYVAALIALRWVPQMQPEGEVSSPLESIREGLRFSFKTPLLLSIFSIDLVAMIFGMPRAVFPELARDTFHMGAEGLGFLYAATSAGALVGALTTGWVGRIHRQGLAVFLSVLAWGSAITLAGLSLWSFALTLVFLAVAGWADVLSAVYRGTMLQEATPDELRGRVSAINIMVVTGGPRLGDVEAGLVAGAFGAPVSVVVGGVACLVGSAAIWTGFPSLRRYRRPNVPSAEAPS
ncbi:MAG: MFS transporter [Actinomycetota bacterium]|nr:MFS transporter [Actinomycetota bacterium]